MIILLLWWCMWTMFRSMNCAILDPALFLSPSPPLKPVSDDISPEALWNQNWESRVQRDADDLTALPIDKVTQSDEATEMMEKSETFWPRFRTADIGLRGIHIPITFGLSGTYGRYGVSNPGIIGSSYASIGDSSLADYGKSALAGSSYGVYSPGNYGTRVYGSSGGASWSGWGNGKWGHYGKG